jgi:restriction endonuclease S subunit
MKMMYLLFEFLYYNLNHKQYILQRVQKGAAIPHVTPSLISSIETILPNSKEMHVAGNMAKGFV